MAKKKGGKKNKKVRLDLDGLPSSAPIPSTKELILAHQISAAEKEILEQLVDSNVFAEKINLQNLQLNEAKAEQQRLIKRMKRQADAYRKFLKHGAKGKWKEGEVVNLGEGLRVAAKKPHVTKADVVEALENAEEVKRKHGEDVKELEDQDGRLEEKLQAREHIIEERKRYRDEGAASDAASVVDLEEKLIVEVENCQEMAQVARKVIDQSKRKIKDRADEEKQRAIDEAACEMSRKRNKGVHRFVERESDWLRRTLKAYRSSAELLESQVTSLEEENLRLVDQVLQDKRKEGLLSMGMDSRYVIPDWRDVGDIAAEGARTDSADSMALVASGPRSTVDWMEDSEKAFSAFFDFDKNSNDESVKNEAELLLTRTPTLKAIALPVYREISAAKEAHERKNGNNSAEKSLKLWRPRIDTPEGVPKELNVVLSADASRPSTAARLNRSKQQQQQQPPSKRDAFLQEIVDHLFALDVRSGMEEEEERKRIESGLRVFGAKVRLHEMLVKSLRDADAASKSSSRKEDIDERLRHSIPSKNDLMLPRIAKSPPMMTSFDSAFNSKASSLNRPAWTSIPIVGVEREAERIGKWPIDAVTMKKVLQLPVLYSEEDDGLD